MCRQSVEAGKAAPAQQKGAKVSKAVVAFGKVRKLYELWECIKDLMPEQKTEICQHLSRPILEDLKTWLEQNSCRVIKDSLTWKAIQTSPNQCELLIGY